MQHCVTRRPINNIFFSGEFFSHSVCQAGIEDAQLMSYEKTWLGVLLQSYVNFLQKLLNFTTKLILETAVLNWSLELKSWTASCLPWTVYQKQTTILLLTLVVFLINQVSLYKFLLTAPRIVEVQLTAVFVEKIIEHCFDWTTRLQIMLWHRLSKENFLNFLENFIKFVKAPEKAFQKEFHLKILFRTQQRHMPQKWIHWMEDDAMWAENTRGCLELSQHFHAKWYWASLRNIQFYRRDSCVQWQQHVILSDSIMVRVMASYHTLYVQDATTINKSSSQCAVKWVTRMEKAQRTNNCGTGSFHVHQLFVSHSRCSQWDSWYM